MTPTNVYVSPELAAFAKRAGVSSDTLAAAIADPMHFADHFDLDELVKLRATCQPDPAPARRQEDRLRLLTEV